MSVARPVNQPTNPEKKQMRSPGGISQKSGNWVVAEESKKISYGYLHTCRTYLMGKEVYLTVRDGMFPLSGGGEVKTQIVPFCPKCEREPEGHGFIMPGVLLL